MIYLTTNEINSYCNIPGVDDNIVAYASVLIDTDIGDISSQQYTRTISFNKKGVGKLPNIRKHLPLISIDSVQIVSRTPFGQSVEEVPTTNIIADEYGHVQYIGGNSFSTLLFGSVPTQVVVKYTAGYASPPEALKRACGMIAMNIRKRGFDGMTAINDIDVRLDFVNDSVITSDIRQILNQYKDV